MKRPDRWKKRSYFDAEKRELRETDPDGILVVRMGPPFDMLFCDLRRFTTRRHLQAKFNLRQMFAQDKDGLCHVLRSEFYKTVKRTFECTPTCSAAAILAARVLHALGPDWARQVAQYPPHLHVPILYVSDRVPRFRQLVQQNPGLAIAVLKESVSACGGQLIGITDYLKTLLVGSNKRIANNLDWPSGTAGILSHIVPSAATFKAISELKKAALSQNTGLRVRTVYPHCRYITRDAIRLASDAEMLERVENSFVVDLCNQAPGEFHAGSGDWEILSNLLQAQRMFPRLRFSTFKSTSQLRRLRDQHFPILNHSKVKKLLAYVFRPPPFVSDDPCFRALEDPLSVLQEYAEMGPNCLPSMIPAISENDQYAYQVLPDAKCQIERATFVIDRINTRDGKEGWILQDARTRRNQPVAETTSKAINEFLSRNQGGLSETDLPPDIYSCAFD